MIVWKDVTDTFSEERRHYNGKYLEQDEVYGDELEVSIFSALEEEWEIYFSFGIFYGIVYAKADQVYTLRDEMKQILQAECDKAGEPSDEFIGWFVEKFHVCMPDDIVFNFDLESFLEQMPW